MKATSLVMVLLVAIAAPLVAQADLAALNTKKAPLLNQSSRGFVGGRDGILISGFVIRTQTNVLMRGAGPALANFGVVHPLPAAEIVLFRRDERGGRPVEVQIASNSNWVYAFPAASDPGPMEDLMTSVGAFAFTRGSRDAALYLQLEPGVYTVHLRGADGSNGVGLQEIFLVTPEADPFNPALRTEPGLAPTALVFGSMGVRLSMVDDAPLSMAVASSSGEAIAQSFPQDRVIPILPAGVADADSQGWSVAPTAVRTGANTMVITDKAVVPDGLKVTRRIELTFSGLNRGRYIMRVRSGDGSATSRLLGETTGSFVFDRLIDTSSGTPKVVQ